MLKLYQFSYSHFCEKARWALDYKQLTYQPRNLLPGPHLLTTKRLAANTTVPILVDGQAIIQGSSQILSYLDTQWPEQALTPQDPGLKQITGDWETYLDNEIGVPIRLCFYASLLPNTQLAKRTMLQSAPWYGSALYTFIFPVVSNRIRDSLGVTPEAAVQATHQLKAAFTKLNEALDGKDFLVGDHFSRADLTACSLLEVLCLPKQLLPEALETFRREHGQDRFFSWVVDMYKTYRKRA